jgi:hypothetical protein
MPTIGKAYCPNDKRAELKEIASNINMTVNYKMVNGNPMFDITINNLTNNFYLVDEFGNSIYNNELNEIVLYNYYPSNNYKFDVYSYDCNDTVHTLYVTMPSYNPYYSLSVCSGLTDYKLCNKWTKHSLSKNDFIKTVNNYKNSLVIVDEEFEYKKVSFFEQVYSFLESYGLAIVVLILIVIIVVQVIKNKRDTFGF